MGDLFRRFWQPVLLSQELPERDGPPVRVKVLGEDLVAFRDTDGRVGLLDPVLSAPRRQPLLRAERGVRPPLRLSRLEVRRGRALRRHADDAAREPLPRQGARGRVSDPRVGRSRVGVPGPGRPRARAAGDRVRGAAAVASLRVEEAPAVQLGAGLRGRARHRALLVPAHAGVVGGRRESRRRCAARRWTSSARAGCATTRAPSSTWCRTTSASWRAPRARPTATTSTGASRQYLLPESRAHAERVPRREHPRPDVGADHRRAVLGVLLHVESRPAR